MSQVKEKTIQYLNEDEPPPKKLISDADMLIKELAEKQRNTVTSLQEQLAHVKEFTKASELVPLAKYNPGTTSLEKFQETAKHFEYVERLKAAGLADDDVQVFFDSLQGDSYLFQKHKNWERSSLKQRLCKIHETVKTYEDRQSHSEKNVDKQARNDMLEYGLSVKPDSIETKLLKFALSNQKEKPKTDFSHPMDNIQDIEQKRFAHLDLAPPLAINKIRRKARKLLNRTQKTSKIIPTISNNEESVLESFSSKIETNILVKESKWDKKIVEVNSKDVKTKTFTCLPQNYYTIKNREIIKLNKNEISSKGLPVLARLSREEIRGLPKFKNYEPGVPSKVLYLKNLTNSIKEDDLRNLFKNHDQHQNVEYKVMKARMRGQAFITFSDIEMASRALDELNGIMLKDRPVIIQFGCARDR